MMRVSAAVLGLGLGFAMATLGGTAMAQESPSLSSSWKSITISQAECIRRGEGAMRGINFTRNYEVVGQSIFGEMDSYTAAIRCVASKGIVWFVVAGPQAQLCSKYQQGMANYF